MQQAELAQRNQLTGAHPTDLSHVGVVVVMATAQFPDVAVAAVPHSRPSKAQLRQLIGLFQRDQKTDVKTCGVSAVILAPLYKCCDLFTYLP